MTEKNNKPRKKHNPYARKKGRYVYLKKGCKPVYKHIIEAVCSKATEEDRIEAERQRQEVIASPFGRKQNGERLRIVYIDSKFLRKAGYRLAVGGDNRSSYYAVRDDQGYFTLDGVSLFCLKGNEGKRKLKELIDKGFFDSPRLQHKDKI